MRALAYQATCLALIVPGVLGAIGVTWGAFTRWRARRDRWTALLGDVNRWNARQIEAARALHPSSERRG